jgi:SAM-dependent MidA family methyltransferase
MSSLPPPSSEALAHSARLRELVLRDIEVQGGWIPFSRYMELMLYAPGLGYYAAGAHKFGSAGDFVTAPEISPLFGRTLARQVAQIMKYSVPHVLELGAGSGRLATDMLLELECLGELPERYAILEVSADLRQRQQALLQARAPHLASRVEWLEELPERIDGAVVGNEVLDALPVHVVHWGEDDILERGVVGNGSNFAWQDRITENEALLQIAEQIAMPADSISEISLTARGLIASLCQRMDQGILLMIDYGFGAREYYHPQRTQGTLMCHYRHYAHDDPFFLTGLQDITAHVDFTAVAESAVDHGAALLGYTSQAHFLMNSGITYLLQETSPENLREYLPLSMQVQKLTSPAEMGELFKVIALGKGMEEIQLSGFTNGDLSRHL